MKIFNSIASFLYGKGDSFKIQSYNQVIIFRLISLITIGFLLVYGLDEAFTTQETLLLITHFTSLGLIFINLLLASQKEKRFNLSKNVFIAIMTFFFLAMLLLGKVKEQDILILSIYPLFTVLLADKRGNLFSLLFFIASVIILFFPAPELYQINFSFTYKILYIVAYVSSFVIILLLKETIQKLVSRYQEEISQVQDELKDKEEFISNVSHQIRTPLNNIVVVSNMINPSELDEKHKDYFDTILASTNNIVDVVNSFSEVTNVDIQERKRYEIRFGLMNTIQNTINLFTDKESEEEDLISVESKVASELIGDPVKIKQVFLNLVEQILKNSEKEKRKIQIYLDKDDLDDNNVKVTFKLITHGLKELVNKIKAKNKQQQKEQIINALEINIAQRTIRSLGGNIDTKISQEEQQFIFSLQFSKVQEKEEQLGEEEQKAKAGESQKPAINLEDANVLLVEDNLINQKIVLLSLKKVVKNVDVANNGKEALDKFGSVKYDMILMDIQMPIMNGIVTTKKIRNIEKSTNTHTPIIAITANALLGDKEECLAAGTDDYISKPFQIETLMNKMKALLEQ
jgi:CheY-like chemotaxis protein/signal transduction histidine kinase